MVFVGIGSSDLSAFQKQTVPGAAPDTDEWGKGVLSGP